ncbi:MAG: TRAP transporter small permease [Azospirillaceae bacterium]
MPAIDLLNRWIGKVCAVFFLLAAVATCYEVVARYLFNRPTVWAHELTVLLCAVAFLLGGAVALERRAHIAITTLYDRMGERGRYLVGFLHLAIIVVFAGLLVYAGWASGWRALFGWETTGSAWNPPLPAIIKPLVTVSAALMLLQALSHAVRMIRTGAPLD